MDEEIFFKTLTEVIRHPKVRQMKKYRQHGNSTTFDHSLNVAVISFRIAKMFGIKISEEELARGAMLHDFFLYDIQNDNVSAFEHGFGHANKAVKNADKYFNLTGKEKDIIYSHMWPLNITHVPRCKESIIVSIADKCSALDERLNLSGKHKQKYVLLKKSA